jgi:hypothetical protein
MHRQTNASETLRCRGDAINEFFAQCYKASLRIPHRILRSQNDFVMQLREGGSIPGLAVADILLALETHAVTPEAIWYLATSPERTHEGSIEAAQSAPRCLCGSFDSGCAFSKVADQPCLTATSAKWRSVYVYRHVEHPRESVIQRREA